MIKITLKLIYECVHLMLTIQIHIVINSIELINIIYTHYI